MSDGSPAHDEKAKMIDSIYARLNSLERDMHTHTFRLDTLESERLPHRVASVEQNTVQIRVDVTKIERIWEGVQKTLAEQNAVMARYQQEIKTMIRTAGFIGAVILGVIELLPFFKSIL
jgi:hypothetical protein